MSVPTALIMSGTDIRNVFYIWTKAIDLKAPRLEAFLA